MEQELKTSRIQESVFNSSKKPAFIPFVEMGYPNEDFSKEMFLLFQKHGAAAIEVGIPFSDPLADGPVIQKASKIALENGMNLQRAFDVVAEIKDKLHVPLVLFSYLNPILNMGIDKFVEELKDKDFAGVIIPDLPIEESEEFVQKLNENGIDFIFLISPASSEERIANISKKSSGFIYLVSSTGVTGVREGFSEKLTDVLNLIKVNTSLPVAVGFGVSKPEHVKNLKGIGVDGAVIASVFLKIVDQCNGDNELALKKLDECIAGLYP